MLNNTGYTIVFSITYYLDLQIKIGKNWDVQLMIIALHNSK